ncbi:MAG: phosphoenolpyruvate--protein phosphotransferase [Myxococcales bacterium]|nr:phosphoenolpyruvate--protein phosphotransferase [Myxococcales bacterium]
MTSSFTLAGVAVSVGVAIGPAWVIDARGAPVGQRRVTREQVPHELARLRAAADRAHAELVEALAMASDLPNGPLRDILEAHRQLTCDTTVRAHIEQLIEEELASAESAVVRVMQGFARSLEGNGGPHLRELAHDVEQVAGHLLDALAGHGPAAEPPAGVVLVVRDLPPRDAVRLRERGVVGLVATHGSATSHTALLARALGIPAVVGVRDALTTIESGALVEVDGFAGACHVRPSAEEQSRARARANRFETFVRGLVERAREPLRTADQVSIELRANIELPSEGRGLLARGAQGVGLFRTEYLFLSSPGSLTEDSQARTYAQLLRDVAPHAVTFRTFDLGVEELARALPSGPSAPAALRSAPRAANPALAPRGLRLALQSGGLLERQLRAVLRASADVPDVPVELLFPMVTSRSELLRALALLSDERAGLRAAGVTLPALRVGAMIEVPAAVVMVDALLPHVDFVAIGTNDLLQYSLAVDRADPLSSRWARPFEPVLLRAVHHVVQQARAADKDVRVCGDAAADPIALPLLLGLGVRHLSMPPPALPVAAAIVRRLAHSSVQQVARAALALADADEIEKLVVSELRASLGDLWAEQGYAPTLG